MTTGTLSVAGQHDWLETSLVANQGYLFTLTGFDDESVVAIGPADDLDDSLLTNVYTYAGAPDTLEVFYEPTTTGNYYIDVTSDTSTNYSITGTPVATDYTDNTTTSGKIIIGGPATTGTLTSLGQHDWLALSLIANQGYLFTVTGLDQYSFLEVGPANELNNSLSTVIPTISGTAATQQIFYEPAATGTYYLDIGNYGSTGAYSASGTSFIPDYADNISTTGVVTIGGPATYGTLSVSGQHDWLGVSLVANQGYLFTLTGLTHLSGVEIGPASDLDNSVTTSTAPAVGTVGLSTNEIWYEPATTGTYYLDVSDDQNTASYTVSGTTVATDYADNESTSGTLTIGGPATTGKLLAGEHDWLKLSLTANQGYLISVTGLDAYAVLEVGPAADLDNSLLTSLSTNAAKSSGTAEVFYEPGTTGAYYLDISNGDNTNTANYSATAKAVTTDYTDNASTSGTVTIGGPATTGTLATPGQHDWLQLSLVANQGYLFTVNGLDAEAQLEVGPAADLNNSLLTNVSTYTLGSATPNEVWYEPATTGTYYLDISDGANTASYSVTGATVPTDYTDNVTTSAVVIACFAEGTRIATKRGEVPVEALRCGDRIRRHKGGYAAVKWLGQRRIACAKHPNPKDVWPVRISAHAFGPNQPARDLLLSPDHAIFAEDVLIPIKYLQNDGSITQVARNDITYWHVEVAHHDVILAENLPVESYLDTGNRTAFANGGEATQLHPNFAAGISAALWEAAACAPLRIAGPAVEHVRAQLRGMAPARAAPSMANPDLLTALQPDWYLAVNPDVAAHGMDPARHYVAFGCHEGRLPCPEIDLIRGLGLIDPTMHMFSMADVIVAGADPVAHFCDGGWKECRQPNSYFDTRWYRNTHNVPQGENPLLHYVLIGERSGLLPSQHFNPTWYRQRYSLPATVSPLAHYLANRQVQTFSPLPTFDVVAYVEANAATLRPNRDPYAHFLAYGSGGLNLAA